MQIPDNYPPMESIAERLFAVVSWGAAGTHWLSRTLNDCPGIYCAHGSNKLWTQFADARALDGLSYLRLIGTLGSGALAAGDVHGISRYDIPAIRVAFGDRFRAVVLVRDPLRRLASLLALFSRFAVERCWDVDYLLDKFSHLEKLLPTGGYDEWLFIHAANMLNAVLDEDQVGPVIRMEDVTTNPASLVDLVGYLTDDAVTAPYAWARGAIASGATNRHAPRAQTQLSAWQRRVLVEVIDKVAIERYRILGYELDDDPMMWYLQASHVTSRPRDVPAAAAQFPAMLL